MSRMSVFNSPFLLGFEQFERTIDRISKLSSDSYPPYNIEQLSSNLLRITIAVAGFEKKNLEIKNTQRENNYVGSLLWSIDRTYTCMGARCLRSWIELPLLNVDEIRKRQNIDNKLVDNIKNSIKV